MCLQMKLLQEILLNFSGKHFSFLWAVDIQDAHNSFLPRLQDCEKA